MDTLFLGGGDGVVEASNAVGRVVVEILAAGVENLVVDIVFIALVIGGAKTPGADDLVASL